ncbi:hypothetical protein GCM10009549_57520 [Streptomyces thermoalcalitolerans]|uniref:Uncharacterized protein n=1 Tax=Streptomyces thermoalcalitolerans TaxID=65605 RepID=A0ABP4ABH0_9ACTN
MFIGRASLSGGAGTLPEAIVGGLVLGVPNDGMNLLGVGTDGQQVVKGLALLVTVGFDVWQVHVRFTAQLRPRLAEGGAPSCRSRIWN